MASHLGEQFDGVVSGAAAYGIYVELPNTVEGLVRIEGFPEGDYSYDGLMQLTDSITGRRYRIGDRVRVIAAAVDVSTGMVDFGLVDENGVPVPMRERGSARTEARSEAPAAQRQRPGHSRRSRSGAVKKEDGSRKKHSAAKSVRKKSGSRKTRREKGNSAKHKNGK